MSSAAVHEEEARTPLRLLVVDEHRSVGEGLRSLLAGDPSVAPVECVRNSALLESASRSRQPHVVLVVLSGRRHCTSVISKIRRIPGAPPVVVLVDSTRSVPAVEAVQAGASSVVTMTESPEDLISAIKAAQRGVSRVPESVLRAIIPRSGGCPDPGKAAVDRLTPREREVLDLLARGCDRHAIAARLYCSPETVRTHIRSVLGKLNAHSTVEAVALAARLGVGHG